jgi:hypothetical protein
MVGQLQEEMKQRPTKSTYKKLAVQWLNEASSFKSSSVLADSLVLRNPLLRQAPKRYGKSINEG